MTKTVLNLILNKNKQSVKRTSLKELYINIGLGDKYFSRELFVFTTHISETVRDRAKVTINH